MLVIPHISMAQQQRIHNLSGRLAMVLGFSLGGFIFPWLLLIAALIAWSLIADWRRPAPDPESIAPLFRATAQTPGWQKIFLDLCESPAEEAFLQAMILAHHLQPQNGQLHGKALTLALQVKMPPYRVDFLVNDRLVVEIDGETYHSSPEAMARDRQRDEYLRTQGYITLRIPARLVFDRPEQAVEQVNAALAAMPVSSSSASVDTQWGQASAQLASGFKTIAMKFGDALEMLDAAKEQQRVANVLRGPRDIFDEECVVIEKAFELAQVRQEIESWIGQKEGRREQFQTNLDNLRAQIVALRERRGEPDRTVTFTPIAPFRAPASGASPQFNLAVEEAFRHLAARRAEYFEQVRLRLQGNERMRDAVRQALLEFNAEGCWRLIA